MLGNLALVALARGNAERARSCLRQAMALETAGPHVVRWSAKRNILPSFPAVMAAYQEWSLSARLHGVCNFVVEEGGKTVEPVDAAVINPLMARTREALGETQFAAEETAGRKLTLDEAISTAQAWLDQSGKD